MFLSLSLSLFSLSHTHTLMTSQVRLSDVVINPKLSQLALVFDWAEHDLGQMIKYHDSIKMPMPEFTIKAVMCQLLKGVQYLHDNWVIHRDLKVRS